MIYLITQSLYIDESITSLITLIFVIGIFLFIWIMGRIVKYTIKKMPWINPDVKNGFIFLVTITQFTVLLSFTIMLLINIGVKPEVIIGSLAILATAIGVAFTGVAANFIGGVYILTTRPFRVGDFIKTQEIEGIVEEIGINFTKLITIDKTIVKIPNGNLINASLLNYTGKMEKISLPIISSGLFNPPKKSVLYKKMIELKLDVTDPPISMKFVREKLDQVCKEYTDVFGFKPNYYFGKHDFRQELYLIVHATDGNTIFKVWPFFMESIMTAVYQKLQEDISL